MPNWCNNNIEIAGPTDTIKQLWEDAQTALVSTDRDGNESQSFGLLSAIAPCPRDLDIVAGSLGDEAEQAKLEAKEQANLKKHGHKNWYDWQVANWGTKWDVSDEGLEFIDNGDGTAVITGWFDSAWAPPIGAYQIFDDMMDNCYITASYHEPGMDFGGFYESEGGEEYLEDLSGQCELDETERDDLFRRIDEEYGIVEQYEMWREEEEA
jgi:hypothetical protein